MPQQAARVQWQPKVEPNLRGTQAAGCESRTDLALDVGNRRDQGSNPVPLDLEAASFPLRPSGPWEIKRTSEDFLPFSGSTPPHRISKVI